MLWALNEVRYRVPFMMEVFPREAGSPEDARSFVHEAAEAAREL